MADVCERYRAGLISITGLCRKLLTDLESAVSERRMNLADPFSITKAMLKTDEGLSLRPYWCPAGYLTIGYGHNLGVTADPGVRSAIRLPSYNTLTLDEAEFILESDIDRAVEDVDTYLGEGVPNLHPVRAAVLICMAFQMGLPGLRSFRGMRTAILQDDMASARREMLDSAWARNHPERARRYARAFRTCELP